MVAAICSLILLGCGQGVKSAKKKKRRAGAGGRHSHLLALISSLQYQCGPCAFIEGKKKRERKERVNDRGPQQGKGWWWWWWWWGLTWKFVGCPIFDLSTFFTGFLRFDLAAGFDPLLFSFSFGTSDEPKPFPYLDSEGGFCFATFPPMAVMKVVWYRQQ